MGNLFSTILILSLEFLSKFHPKVAKESNKPLLPPPILAIQFKDKIQFTHLATIHHELCFFSPFTSFTTMTYATLPSIFLLICFKGSTLGMWPIIFLYIPISKSTTYDEMTTYCTFLLHFVFKKGKKWKTTSGSRLLLIYLSPFLG